MAASYRVTVLTLYKQLLKESKQITDYNFRQYAIRRSRDAFRENKNVSGEAEIESLLKKGRDNLEVLKRQAVISQLFGTGKLVIESSSPASN